jgi:hypothetical protein
MTMDSLSREQLYDLVWSKPMSALGPEFGVSDVALKKRCKKLGIPTPTRGYWAKVEAGKRPHKKKLPDSIPAAVRRRRNPESLVYFSVEGADYTLSRPHAYVTATKKALRVSRPDLRGLISTHGPSVGMMVGAESSQRALWILDRLLHCLEKGDVRLELRDGYHGGLHISVEDASIRLQIREAVREFPNPDVKSTDGMHPLSWGPSKIYRCSGRLRIQAKLDHGYGREWSDRPSNPLDSCITEVAGEIQAYLMELVDANQRRRERARVEEENRRLAWIRQQEREAEEKRLLRLEKLAQQLEVSNNVARLADEVEAALIAKGLDPTDLERATTWLNWARNHSASIHPVNGIVERLLDVSDGK